MVKKKQRKILSWIITFLVIVSNFSGLTGIQVVKADTIPTTIATNKTFDIVEITDFHGQLLDSTNTKPVGAALAYVVKGVKTTNPDRTLIIGGGDLYQGTPVSNVLRGVPVQKVMSSIGMEVTALGNHEFDWGLDAINNTTMTGAAYSIVCANMYKKGTDTRPYKPYKIFTKDGVRIAVIGAILKDAPTIIMPALVAPFDFRDPATEINLCAKAIRDGNLADIVLADVHDGGASLNTMVNNLHGVDAVFGGHTHTSYDDVNKDADSKDVPTLNAMNAGKGYIDLKITFSPAKKIVSFSPKGQNWVPLTTTVTSPTDPICKKIVDDASVALLPTFNVVIGNDTEAYTSGQADSPYGESQLGNWMADVVKNYSKSPADVGMVNNGGIRLSPIPAGDVTVGTIFNIMPFDNTICTTSMTGLQLKKVFEQAVKTGGVGIQISGVKFTYDSTKTSYAPVILNEDKSIKTPEVFGQRVTSIIREKDGTAVADTDTLKVNAPDFVATGGDGFTGFLDPTIVKNLVDSHYTVRDALTDDVKLNKKVTSVMNSRVDNKISTISIIGTSDVHGAIFPIDYNTGLLANVGLAKVSTYVKSVRAINPNTMLIDNGDTIQGTPLSYYYDMIDTKTEYPMMKVMGAMGYDTWTLGNHEFNYGLDTLNRIINDATKEKIAVLSANTYKSDNANFVQPYIIKSFIINGKTTKVAILGLTTKTIPSWEDPAHYADLHFNDLVLEAQKWVPIIKAAGADVIVASIHSGIKNASDTIPENQVDAVAQQVSGIDAILCGHAHTGKTYSYTNPDGKVIPVVEPKNGDGIFSQIDLNIDETGKFVGVNAFNVTLPATTVADPAILAIAQPYQDATLAYTSTVIGKSTAVFEGAKQLTEPSSIMELVNKVQAAGAGTTLSIAAPLSPTAKVPQGDIKRQDIMGVYVYENYLFGLKMTGSQLKNWLEWSVRYYKQVANASDPVVKDSVLNIADYNLDQLYGATYDIDLTMPACTVDSTGKVITGNRIKNLKINGVLVKDSDTLKVAVNNYRYNGGGGFMAAAGFVPGSKATIDATFYDSGKTLGDDGQVRNMMFKYVQDNKTITPTNSNNWKISKVAVGASTSSVSINRLSGLNRIETSVAIAKYEYSDKKPDTVVLASAHGFADGLAGSGLAYKYNAPLLLVNKSVSDSKSVFDYITANLGKGKNIYILGETGVISKDISDNLIAQGYKVIRLGGKDRYETNQKIADYLNTTKNTSIVISSGDGFADALSVSSIADIKNYTVLLNGKDNLSANVSKDITNLQPATVYIVGGTGVLSANIEAQIKKLNGRITIVRLGGKDRYETSLLIADYFKLTTDTMTVASGISFPDALCGSVLAARSNSSVLLVDNKNITKQKALLTKAKITKIIVLGGEGVISKNIVTSLAK